jgi:hypothetical protein
MESAVSSRQIQVSHAVGDKRRRPRVAGGSVPTRDSTEFGARTSRGCWGWPRLMVGVGTGHTPRTLSSTIGRSVISLIIHSVAESASAQPKPSHACSPPMPERSAILRRSQHRVNAVVPMCPQCMSREWSGEVSQCVDEWRQIVVRRACAGGRVGGDGADPYYDDGNHPAFSSLGRVGSVASVGGFWSLCTESKHAEEVERCTGVAGLTVASTSALPEGRCYPTILQGSKESVKTSIFSVSTQITQSCASRQASRLSQRIVVISHQRRRSSCSSHAQQPAQHCSLILRPIRPWY